MNNFHTMVPLVDTLNHGTTAEQVNCKTGSSGNKTETEKNQDQESMKYFVVR